MRVITSELTARQDDLLASPHDASLVVVGAVDRGNILDTDSFVSLEEDAADARVALEVKVGLLCFSISGWM